MNYRTRCLVTRVILVREHDLLVKLVTREYGSLSAVASGVLKPGGKLQSSLALYSEIVVDLVPGRAGWRIVTAEPVQNFYYEVTPPELLRRNSVAQVLTLFERLTPGEEPLLETYDDVVLGLERIVRASKSNILLIETLIVFRLLAALGYVVVEKNAEVLDAMLWREERLPQISRAKLVREINNALQSSQL